jgi:hypothetical protein
MGFFGGGGNSGGQDTGRSESDALITQQYKQNQAEIEQKKKSIYQERLSLIKSQSGQNWKGGGTL